MAGFADVDESLWPVVVVRMRHAAPTDAEQRTYFAALARVLNDRVSPTTPAFLVFDVSGVAALAGINAAFFQVHNDFNRAYHARFGLCSGFGVVAPPLLAPLIRTALDLAPSKRPCANYATLEEAVAAGVATSAEVATKSGAA